MARSIPIEWLDETGLYNVEIFVHNELMTCGMSIGGSSKSFGQMMVNQTPRYDNAGRKRKRHNNQVIGKSGIIRKDKRLKAKYF